MRLYQKRAIILLAYGLLFGVALAILAPLAWTIFSSFRPAGDIFSQSLPTSIQDFTLENYRGLYEPITRPVGDEIKIFPPIPYARYFLNNILVSTGFTLLALFFGSLGGFSLASTTSAAKKFSSCYFWVQ